MKFIVKSLGDYKVLFTHFIMLILLSSFYHSSGQILNNKTKITIDPNGEKTTERIVLIQVSDKQSNWLSHVEINHSPNQDLSFNYARITDFKGNTLRKLKKKDLKTRNNLSYQAFYQDNLISEFDLYWNQYPYIIEYSYSITEKEYLNVAWWTPLLYTNIATKLSSLEIIIPSDFDININQNGKFSYRETKKEDQKSYYWESSNVQKPEDETFPPPLKELIPIVWVVPTNFKYGGQGSTESWSSFGHWLNNLNEGTDQLPLNEELLVGNLIQGIDDETEKVKKIYYYLQDHTRYINVAIDVGGLKSYPASYVSRNKYGDCKALTTYMKSMLKSIGIDSYYTVINAGENKSKIKTNFPSQQFNHVILAIPMQEDTIWLENTANYLPFGYLGTFTQNRQALVVDGLNSKLAKTPKLQPSDVLKQREYEFICNDSNTWKGNISLKLKGSSFESFRYFITNQDKSDQEIELKKLIDINGFELDTLDITKHCRDSNYVSIQVQGNLSNPIRKIGTWDVINPLNIKIPDFEEPSKRQLNVRINYPINKSDKTIYFINHMDSKTIQMPVDFHVKNSFGEYSTKYSKANNSIVVNEVFTLLDNDIPLEQYSEFYAFIQSIINEKKKSAILIK